MTIHYVDSNASGANNGTSKTDAWTSLTSAVGIAAGDEIRQATNHNQNPGSGGAYNFSNSTVDGPITFIVMDFSDDSYDPAANVHYSGAASDMSVTGRLWMAGLYMDVADDATWSVSGRFTDCIFSPADNFTLLVMSGEIVTFDNCTIDAGGAFAIGHSDTSSARFYRCTFSSPAAIAISGEGGFTLFEDCDLSAITSIGATLANGAHVVLRRCLTHASLAFAGTSIGQGCSILVERCTSGTISAPQLGLTKWITYYGTVTSSLSRYRTGGADDGEQANAHSWEMVSNTKTIEQKRALDTPPITRWVDAGDNQTLTVFVASGATLQDDEFWIEVESPNEIDSPNTTAQGKFQTTRLAPLGTPANLTTDGDSTWNGTGVGTKQKLSVTISPAVAGPVTVRCYLAKASTTVYLDPRLEIS